MVKTSHKVQIITFPSGEEMIVLPKADYDALIEAIEDAEDIAIFDARKAEVEKHGVLPAEVVPRADRTAELGEEET